MLDIIKNWKKIKSEINKRLFFESDSSILSIRMMNVRLGTGDKAIKRFLDTAETLCDELLQKIFKIDRVDDLPFEFIKHEEYGELKFGDRKLFEAMLSILQTIFLGDIVKDYLQDNFTAIDNFINKLTQSINPIGT